AALKAYRVFANGKPDAVLEKMIQDSNMEQAKAFCSQYGAKLEDKFPLKCVKCGSSEMTRASGEHSLSSDNRKNEDEYITVNG
ncbi:MAG: hypothetical protein K8R21_05150, partial [Leptospira sp.]|nr:hypothetical protein [Leptospira sp.]